MCLYIISKLIQFGLSQRKMCLYIFGCLNCTLIKYCLMPKMGYAIVVVLLVFLCHEVSSLPSETISLLKFKQSFTIDTSHSGVCQYSSKTSSWNMSRDCCSWAGVVCDETTGHVIELDLSCSRLVGKIDSNSSLFQLSHLQRLNLSLNDLSGSRFSPEFGRLSSLTHLDLSGSYFSGHIPSEISHLSKLQSLRISPEFVRLSILTRLDLLGSYFLGQIPSKISHHSKAQSLRISRNFEKPRLVAHDFKLLLQNLTELRELDLTNVNISSTIPLNFSSHLTTLILGETELYGIIPEGIFHLPNLETLDLSFNNQLNGSFPKTKRNSSASLKELDLDEVNFSDNLLPESLGYLTSLNYLSLHRCNLGGPIPESLLNLTRIEYLQLVDNSLNGTIPSGMFSLPLLTALDLSNNHFSGQIQDFNVNSNSLFSIVLSNNQLQGHLPNSIQNLVNLIDLDLSFNNFSGTVDVSLFSDLKQLSYLRLSYNNISLTNENKANVTLPDSLHTLELAACDVKELEFLRSAKQLRVLDLSNNKIQGRIPDWAWSNWMFLLSNLNISHNMLTSVDSIPLQSLYNIDLRSNLLEGSLPIPPKFTRYFFISHNNLTGEIPSSICNLTSLVMLDLARNNLKGEIPRCLGNITYLQVLDMHHNNFSGNIPTTFRNGSSLSSLNLHGNKLEGKIPQYLNNWKQLEVLDLGDNRLNDTFPVWLGTLPKLKVLSLRSNKLHGSIGTTQNLFPQLRILDLSSNAFTGKLPTSLFQHLKAMRTIDQTMNAPIDAGNRYYQDSVVVVSKGLELEVVRILFLYTTLDLSNNNFEGHIPSIMGDLIALRVLNISHNELEGHIPSSLGSLSLVESLDLSSNHLVGKIPAEFASLTSLEVFNLSYNHLEGCIPQGTQLQTFESNSYEGNDGLRGFPVTEGCGDDHDAVSGQLDDEESNSEFWSDFRKAALTGYGSGLCIGLSIMYIMISTGRPIWVARIIVELEHKLMMGKRKKQRRQRNYRRRNNHTFL